MKIRKQNPVIHGLIDDGEEFKIIYLRQPTDDQKKTAVTVSVSTKIRKVLKNNGDRCLRSCQVVDKVYVKRCNKCNGFNHYAKNCIREVCCGYCGSNSHESMNCTNEDQSQHEMNCIICQKKGLESKGHFVFLHKCPSLMNEQKKFRSLEVLLLIIIIMG